MAEEEHPRDKLLHVTDLHFWKLVTNPFELLNKRFLGNFNVWLRRRHRFAIHRAEEFAGALAETGVNQVLLTGDFTSTAHHDEFAMAKAFLERLEERGMQALILPGNHDVYTFEASRKQRFEQYLGTFAPDGRLPVRTDLPGGTPLILVPTAVPNPLSARGRVTDETVSAVKRIIDDCPGGPVVVAAHYPLLDRTNAYSSHPGRRLGNAYALRACLGDIGRPILCAAGHVHRFSHVRDPAYPELHHLTTAAFVRQDPDAGIHGEFTEIHVMRGHFRIFRHQRTRDRWTRQASENTRT